jgi:hypothetical protein
MLLTLTAMAKVVVLASIIFLVIAALDNVLQNVTELFW